MSVTQSPLTPHVGVEIAGITGVEFVNRTVAEGGLAALDR
jgi:hypothetical protein